MHFHLLIVVVFLIVIYVLTFGFRVVREWLDRPEGPKDR